MLKYAVQSRWKFRFFGETRNSKIIQGEFSLKNLVILLNKFVQSIKYVRNDLPLVVKYNVASLGEIKLCLAPLPSTN